MNTWTAAEAKRRFAKVLQASASAPQILLLRGKPTGVVVSYESFIKNQREIEGKSLVKWLSDLSEIHEVEEDMELPPRRDRADPFGDKWE
jgi:prevent-host-death family protein